MQWAHNNNTFFFWVKYNKMHCRFKNYKHRLKRNMKDFKRNSSTDLKGKPQKLKRDNMVGSAMDDGASGRRLWRRKTGKIVMEWQLPVSGLASAVADVLSDGG